MSLEEAVPLQWREWGWRSEERLIRGESQVKSHRDSDWGETRQKVGDWRGTAAGLAWEDRGSHRDHSVAYRDIKLLSCAPGTTAVL